MPNYNIMVKKSEIFTSGIDETSKGLNFDKVIQQKSALKRTMFYEDREPEALTTQRVFEKKVRGEALVK